MVFAEIREDEKEAFFSLLDEYFTHRPHLLPTAAAPAAPPPPSAGQTAAGFVGRTLAANPQATAALVSGALRANAPKDSAVAQAAANPRISGQLGKAVASGMSTFSTLTKPPAPQPPTKPPGVRTNTPSGLVSRKAVGSFSTQSAGAFLASGAQNAWNYKKPKPEGPQYPISPPPPGAGSPGHEAEHEQQGHHPAFAPPPRRTVAPAVQPEPEPEERYDEAAEQQGEWVEALYDYQGDAETDISLTAGEQFLVLERTSADWWTGEHNGKRGLFPASYVKVL